MDLIPQIEAHFGFKLPGDYRALVEWGYTTYHSENYLWVDEAEWIQPEDMTRYTGFCGEPKPGLVPFAFTGGADLWCWQINRITNAGEPAIVHCPRDCYEGEWYAPSFSGWLYRVALNYVTFGWDDDEEAKSNLKAWTAVLHQFGKTKWQLDLETLLQSEPKVHFVGRHASKTFGLLTESEYQARVRSELGEDYLDKPYI